jgi:hypothetical protein
MCSLHGHLAKVFTTWPYRMCSVAGHVVSHVRRDAHKRTHSTWRHTFRLSPLLCPAARLPPPEWRRLPPPTLPTIPPLSLSPLSLPPRTVPPRTALTRHLHSLRTLSPHALSLHLLSLRSYSLHAFSLLPTQEHHLQPALTPSTRPPWLPFACS